MTVLLTQYRRDYSRLGRCDARCHEAVGSKCGCICAGLFHGKGFAQACRELPKWKPQLEAHGYVVAAML